MFCWILLVVDIHLPCLGHCWPLVTIIGCCWYPSCFGDIHPHHLRTGIPTIVVPCSLFIPTIAVYCSYWLLIMVIAIDLSSSSINIIIIHFVTIIIIIMILTNHCYSSTSSNSAELRRCHHFLTPRDLAVISGSAAAFTVSVRSTCFGVSSHAASPENCDPRRLNWRWRSTTWKWTHPASGEAMVNTWGGWSTVGAMVSPGNPNCTLCVSVGFQWRLWGCQYMG